MVQTSSNKWTFTSNRDKFNKQNQFIGEASYKLYNINLGRTNSRAVPLNAAFNAKNNIGSASAIKNNMFYFTGENRKADLNWKEATAQNALTIYKAVAKDGKWKVEPVKEFKDKKHSYFQPTLSNDGNTIYFVSDMPGGFGGTDIYVSKKTKDGEWSAPVNLGPTVNTEENDLFPYLQEDGVLFFSTKGHKGFGGLDVFVTLEDEEGNWKNPENLGSPVNTPSNDFSISFDKELEVGYFSSDRDGGKGEDDIYRMDITKLDNEQLSFNTKTKVDDKVEEIVTTSQETVAIVSNDIPTVLQK